MSLTIHYYVLPYNPIAFKSVVLCFLKLLASELIHLAPPQSFSTIQYLVNKTTLVSLPHTKVSIVAVKFIPYFTGSSE